MNSSFASIAPRSTRRESGWAAGLLHRRSMLAVAFAGAGLLAVGSLSSLTAQVTVSGDVTPAPGPSGTVPNPWNTYSSPLYIGNNAAGSVAVGDGGSVITWIASVGRNMNAPGYLTVEKTGSFAATSLHVGNGGYGEFYLLDEARATIDSTSAIGSGSEGYALIQGPDVVWGAMDLIVGNYGKGTVEILEGAKVTSIYGKIGYLGTAGDGSVTVSGTNSHWTNLGTNESSGYLTIGHSTKGAVTIADGGKVTAFVGVLGGFSDGAGTVTVKDAGSLWELQSMLAVGADSTLLSTMRIENGGKVSNTLGYIGGARLYSDEGSPGNPSNGNGQVTVTGKDSLWENSENLYVGRSGSGHMIVSDGGTVTNRNGFIAFQQYGSLTASSATITGENSRWTNTGTLQMGGIRSQATLEIHDKALVQAQSISLRSGTIRVTSEGVLETGFIANELQYDHLQSVSIIFNGGIVRATGHETNFLRNFGEGTVRIDEDGFIMDTNGFNVGIATNLTGTGGLTKRGEGILKLSGDSTFTGLIEIEEGGISYNGTVLASIRVDEGALLSGNAVFKSDVLIKAGGILAPGNSPGTLTFEDGLTLESGAILQFELGMADSDLLTIDGGDFLAMGSVELRIDDAGDFDIGIYTLIDARNADSFVFDLSNYQIVSSLTGYQFELFEDNGLLQLKAELIPEPSTWALALGGVALLFLVRRRPAIS